MTRIKELTVCLLLPLQGQAWYLPVFPDHRPCHVGLCGLKASASGKSNEGEYDEDGIDIRWKGVLEDLDRKKKERMDGIDKSDEGDEEGTIDSIYDLRSKIREAGRNKMPFNKLKTKKRYLSEDDFPLNRNTIAEIENILGAGAVEASLEESTDGVSSSALKADGTENSDTDTDTDSGEDIMAVAGEMLSDDDDSVYLDANDYLQYSQKEMTSGKGALDLNYDGLSTALPSDVVEQELNLFGMIPEPPYDIDNREPTLEDVMRVQDMRNTQQPLTPEEEKAIFDEMFKDEQIVSQRSEQDSSWGVDVSEESIRTKKNKEYQKALFKDLSILEKNLKDFEAELEKRRQEIVTTALDETKQSEAIELVDHVDASDGPTNLSQELEELENENDEWVLVNDPSTGDSFYWNQFTEEMRYIEDDLE